MSIVNLSLRRLSGLRRPYTQSPFWSLALPRNDSHHWIRASIVQSRSIVKVTKNTSVDKEMMMKDLSSDVMRLYSQGQLTQASYAADYAIQKAKELFGVDHIALASAYSNRGFIAKELGDWDDAIELYQLSLKTYEKAGNEGSGRTIVLQNLGNALRIMANSEKDSKKQMELRYRAKIVLEDALKAVEQENGKKSLKYASALQKMGNLHRDMNKYETAETFLRQAVEICGEVDVNSRFFYSAKNDLALTLKYMGKNFDESKALYESAIEYYIKRLGEENKETIVAKHNLAELLDTKEDTKPLAQKIRMELLMTETGGQIIPKKAL